MKRSRLFIPITLCISALLMLLSVAQAQQATFRIGILGSSDSPLAKGAQLAIDQINADGGVRGADGTVFRLQAVIQGPDVQGSYTRAIANLGTASVVAIVGPETTAEVEANLAGLLALNRPILTPALGNGLLLDDNTDLLFRSRAKGLSIDRGLAAVMVRELNINDIQNVLLDQDPENLEGLVGFSTAAQSFGAATLDPIIEAPSESLTQTLIRANPQAIALFGAPALANEVVIALRNARYPGIIAYNNAEHPQFRDLLSPAHLDGILSGNSWSYALNDEPSSLFTLAYLRATGQAPSAIAAAAYDSVVSIATALEAPGELGQNISRLPAMQGAQGQLSPANLPLGELIDEVVVVRHLLSGGQQALARFDAEQRITTGIEEADDGGIVVIRATPTLTPTPTPTATPTLDGVYGTVVSQVLNVRTGPGTNYDILGQLREGETVRLLGANLDFSWAVISFRGTQAWISTAGNLLEIAGDVRTLPFITPPPTPTPGPTSTPAPTATLSTPDLVITNITPTTLNWNTTTTVNVTVLNGGGQQSGAFTIAGGFEPGPVVGSLNVPAPGLAPGQSAVYPVNVTLNGATGIYTAPVTVDFLGQVNEGVGENNNTFAFSYKLDHVITQQGVVTIGNGGGFNLDGIGGNDITFNGGSLSVTCGTCVVSLTSQGLSFENAHHDIVASTVNASSLGLATGMVVGVKTDGAKYAVLRIDSTDGFNLTITYRVYQ